MRTNNGVFTFRDLPFFLTLLRLFAAFLVFPPLFLLTPWQTSSVWAIIVCFLFLVVGLTDFIDGWLARLWRVETTLGRVLDPIADKVFIMGALFFLSVAGRIDVVIAILLVAREFLVMGLREVSPELGCSVPVSWWGKGKMAVQLLLCSYLIIHPGYYGCACGVIFTIEYLLLTGAVLLSLISAVLYVRRFLSQAGCSIRKPQE